jgi:hypothetical protein
MRIDPRDQVEELPARAGVGEQGKHHPDCQQAGDPSSTQHGFIVRSSLHPLGRMMNCQVVKVHESVRARLRSIRWTNVSKAGLRIPVEDPAALRSNPGTARRLT